MEFEVHRFDCHYCLATGTRIYVNKPEPVVGHECYCSYCEDCKKLFISKHCTSEATNMLLAEMNKLNNPGPDGKAVEELFVKTCWLESCTEAEDHTGMIQNPITGEWRWL